MSKVTVKASQREKDLETIRLAAMSTRAKHHERLQLEALYSFVAQDIVKRIPNHKVNLAKNILKRTQS